MTAKSEYIAPFTRGRRFQIYSYVNFFYGTDYILSKQNIFNHKTSIHLALLVKPLVFLSMIADAAPIYEDKSRALSEQRIQRVLRKKCICRSVVSPAISLCIQGVRK